VFIESKKGGEVGLMNFIEGNKKISAALKTIVIKPEVLSD